MYCPGGLCTPAQGQGEGPVEYKFFLRKKDDKLAWSISDEERTQEAMGGAGVERSGTESSGTVYPSSWYSSVISNVLIINHLSKAPGW